jgi:ribosomal protein S18 acetylase RimI-like enzyme
MEGSHRPHVWRADATEAESVARLLVAFRDHLGLDWPSPNAFLAGVERLLDDVSTDFLLGAPHADAPPAGIVQLRCRWSVWRAGPDCELEDLYVDPGARRVGLGRALLDAAIAQARERDCRRISLDAASTNEGGLALYRAVGFSADAYEGGESLCLKLRLDGR